MPNLHFERLRFLATAARGTEQILRDELVALGIERAFYVPGGIEFRASFAEAMRVCLWARTANRVLLELGSDRLRTEKHLYPSIRNLPLLEHFTADSTFVVDAQTRGEVVRDRRWATMLAKDAIVDTIRDRFGRRPNIDRDNPQLIFSLTIRNEDVRYYLDLSGAPLFQRGYRQSGGDAPMKETLAAALILFSGWNGLAPFHDPFCGSGTLVAEAAMIATDTAPGRMRAFGFQQWPQFDEHWMRVWSELVTEARDRAKPRPRGILTGGDVSRRTLELARENLTALGFRDIELREGDFADTMKSWSLPGYFVANPPYGTRLPPGRESHEMMHARLGDVLESFAGNHAALISTEEALTKLDMEPEARVNVFNGRIPAAFVRFQL